MRPQRAGSAGICDYEAETNRIKAVGRIAAVPSVTAALIGEHRPMRPVLPGGTVKGGIYDDQRTG